MSFQKFVGESGLKVLAVAQLSAAEYSIFCYLLNGAASGLEELITTEKELGSVVGVETAAVALALETMKRRNMIRLRVHERRGVTIEDNKSMRLSIQYDTAGWDLEHRDNVNAPDAIVFPFRREGDAHLVEVDSGPKQSVRPGRPLINKPLSTMERIEKAFCQDREVDDQELRTLRRDAEILVQTHPVDQILLLLRHFKKRIPTLSLLASSWRHYLDVYEQERYRVDLLDAKQKHDELDEKFRQSVRDVLDQRKVMELLEEEVTVLEALENHKYPRRQLFWAYQCRGKYPNLKLFFSDNMDIMLPVSAKGDIVKKRPHRDSKQ